MMRGRYRPGQVAMVIMSTTCALLACRPGLTDQHAMTSVKSKAQRPNIILIMTDDQGYGDLSCYGSKTIHTPHIDRLASEGTRFTQNYAAAPICTPTRAALMTGCYASRVGLSTPLHVYDHVGIHPDETTLPEAFQALGYRTGCVGKWHLGHTPKHFPTRHGFDFYFGTPLGHMFNRPETGRATGDVSELFLRNESKIDWVEAPKLTDRTTSEGIAFIRRNQQHPFFLFISHSMPHEPLAIDEKNRGRSKGGIYGDVIECIDDSVGRIRSTLDRLNLSHKTIVLFTSDNGPKPGHGSAAPLRGFKHEPFEGGVRTPLVVWGPGRIARRPLETDMIATMDLYPTLLALCGKTAVRNQAVDGLDLSHLLTGDTDAKAVTRNEFFYFVRHGVLAGVRIGPWKLLKRPKQRNATIDEAKTRLPPELFHLPSDPGERKNFANTEPKIVARLSKRLDDFRKSLESTSRSPAGAYRQ